MKNVNPLELRSAVPLPIEMRDDNGDPLEASIRAVNELRAAWTQFRGDAGQDVNLRALIDRIDAIETRAARPGTGTTTAADLERETRAIATFARTGNDTEMRAASTDNDPSGGYFVIPTVESGILTIVRDRAPMRELANGVTISTDAYERIVDPDESGGEWVTERGVRPQNTKTPEIVKVRIPVGEIYAAPKTTRRILDDTAFDVAGWLLGSMGDKFTRTEADAHINGTGANDRPRGILNYETDTAKDFVRDWGKIQRLELAQVAPTAAQLTMALVNTVMSLQRVYRANASWLTSRSAMTYLQSVVDGQGRRLWSMDGSLVNGEPPRLLGFPVNWCDEMPDWASDSFPLAFGDFKQGYTIVDRHGIRIARDEISAKGFVIFDGYRRVGGGMVDFNAIKLLKVG